MTNELPKTLNQLLRDSGIANRTSDSILEELGSAFSTGVAREEPKKTSHTVLPDNDEICYICDRDLTNPNNAKVAWKLSPLLPHPRVRKFVFCCLEHLEVWLKTIPYGDERDNDKQVQAREKEYLEEYSKRQAG